MKREIRQNGKTVLYSGDGHSIPMIFNNLVGKNLKGREYSDYIAFVCLEHAEKIGIGSRAYELIVMK